MIWQRDVTAIQKFHRNNLLSEDNGGQLRASEGTIAHTSYRPNPYST